jgi:tubulin-folding cofactor B
MAAEFQVVTQSFVNVLILTEKNEFGVEKRFAKDIRIGVLKNKLELITGYEAIDMKIKLLTKDKKFICDMDDDEKMLGFYPAEDGYILEVKGCKSVPTAEEDPNFKRYELTDEEYAKKKNTVKEFKLKNKLGQYSEQHIEVTELKERQAKEKIENEKKALDHITIGSRCEVRAPNAPTRLGTVMYKGNNELCYTFIF